MSQEGIDDHMTLSKFQRIFYKHQIIEPRSTIPRRGEDSSKSAPSSPLTLHISDDGSGSKQVDPLKALYKRDLTPSAQDKFSLLIHLEYLRYREKTDLIVKGSLARLSRSPSIVSFFLFKSSNCR